MSKLLEYNADVNICNNEGLTAVSAKNFYLRFKNYFLENNIEGDSMQSVVQVFLQLPLCGNWEDTV